MVKLKRLQKFLIEKGIIFPTSEIYGSVAGFFDYGPPGVELKRAVKDAWWRWFVQSRDDVQGMDGSIITNPQVWEASGHVDAFHDPLVECKTCHHRSRADHVIEDKLDKNADGLSLDKLEELISQNDLKCPRCGGELREPKHFNLMFHTEIGPVDGETAYLRPETAQLIFADFFRIYRTGRQTLPFGIAQIGKAFRNEISPRNFLFRSREFEQMEIEFFVRPSSEKKIQSQLDPEMNVLTREDQKSGKEASKMKASEMAKQGLTSSWQTYWLAQSWSFLTSLGLKTKNLRLRQHTADELSHYATDTWDIDYNYPFGWKELVGVADRSNYDLKQHAELSGKELVVAEDGEKVEPRVLEPSFGVGRLVMALLADAWHDDGRQTLRLNPEIAPNQVAVFPLVNKEGMDKKAIEIHKELRTRFRSFYDDKGSVGRRYRRQDSIGTPWCVTVDGQTMRDGTVTLRERDSMEQTRVAIEDLSGELESRLNFLNRRKGE